MTKLETDFVVITAAHWVDDKTFLIADPEKGLKLIKDDNTIVHTWKDRRYLDIAFSPKNNSFVYSSPNEIGIIDLESKEVKKTMETEFKIR